MSTRTGSIDAVKLYKIFRSSLDQRLTGTLVLTRGQIAKRVRLVDGVPVRVQSNARRESTLQALQDQGFLSPEDVARVMAHREAHRVAAEDALLALGLVDVTHLRSIEAKLGRRRLLELFTWHEGEYAFTAGAVSPEPADEALELVPILIDAAARVTQDADCQAFVSQFGGQLVRLTPWAETYGPFFDAAFGVPNTRQVLARPATPEELVLQLRDPERVARQVFTLVIAGLAAFQRPEVQATRPEPAAPPATRPAAPAPAAHAPFRTNVGASPAPAAPQVRAEAPRAPAVPRPVAAPTTGTAPSPEPPPARAPQPSRAPKPLDDKARAALAEVARIHEAMRRQTHYELLGVQRQASPETIRTQFRKLARDFHVDRFTRFGLPGEQTKQIQEVFMAINRAHEVLSEPERRQEYDLQIDMGARGQRLPGGQGGTDLGAVFRAETLVRDGTLLIRNGNAAAAKGKFEEALAGSPGDVVARAGQAFAEFLLASAAGTRSLADAAAARLEEVCRDNEARDEPFLYLGRVYRTRGNVDKAVVWFKRALDVNPRCAEAASELRHLQRKAEAQPADKSQGGLFSRKKA